MVNPEQTREGWDAHAQPYDEMITPFSMRVASDALTIAGAGPGMKLLDVAAGGGALSIPAAKLGADVTAVDFSPVMVDRLKQKASEQKLPNIDARVMDGTALELDDETFDLACSQWGVMLFPDRQAGLQEMFRVTKPGGKGVMVVFGPPDRVPMFSLFFQAVRMTVPDFPFPPNSPLFSLQNPDDLKGEMESAGFSDIQVNSQVHVMEMPSADALWRSMEMSAPVTAAIVRRLSDEQQASGRERLGELLSERFGESPFQISVTTHVGTGVR